MYIYVCVCVCVCVCKPCFLVELKYSNSTQPVWELNFVGVHKP